VQTLTERERQSAPAWSEKFPSNSKIRRVSVFNNKKPKPG
jgi:hypothetical protein